MDETKPTVFVVDDDAAARESVAAVVRGFGAHVKTYRSAEEFLSDFDVSQWGCLVTDVRMGGMSGIQLQEELRKKGVSLPVILISGYADVPTAVRAMRSGAVTLLEKPCTDEELRASISKAIAWHQRRRRVDARHADLRTKLARLSPEEREVMRFMVEGTPNKVIASQLQIGLRTVELRRANIMKKMEANSLAELVRLGIAADALPEPPSS